MSFDAQPDETTQLLCDRCAQPVTDPLYVEGKPLHHGPAHCSQVQEVADVAAFLEGLRVEHDAVVFVVSYADGRWHLDMVDEERAGVRVAQEPGEALAGFLLRVSGGLLPLP